MLKNIYVIYGGVSVEHEISLLSATNVINSLDRKKYNVFPVYVTKSGTWIPFGKCDNKIKNYKDLVIHPIENESIAKSLSNFLSNYYVDSDNNIFFPIIHGTYGEDGVLQGLLEILDIPYVGNGVLSSALCMDKAITNQLFEENNIPQAKYKILLKEYYDINDKNNILNIISYLGLPIYVKPCNAGSSIGVTCVKNEEDIFDAIDLAFKYDSKILLEEAIVGDELQVSVIGNENPIASLPGISRVQQEFYNYEGKYFDDNTVHIVPFELKEGETEKVQNLAKKVYTTCNCSGLARVDIFLRDRDREMLVNEINTSPGMTNHSMTTMLWKVTDNVSFPELLDRLVDYAIDKYNKKKTLIKEI
ncbi:D-alanine--D-alanine ligase family protein [Miniphocaeibacter massiliensis]|uniref:D-alanine--D-alanine ligase family protein n=1 Tax=Miniphocaeibacter massiliensis TaxID=2041841 RepID=UPI000C1BA3E1|nr:D-alanine--D-alanine ligase family protein [Miniphocaeibacter massiliensis]